MTLELPFNIPIDTRMGTRSNHRWTAQPGSMDKLNARIIWPRSGHYGIPPLEPVDADPPTLTPWDRYKDHPAADCLHFWRDDYRFEVVWNRPERALARLAAVGMALTPDFSCWLEMPPALQIWQTYRSRWCGAWWQHSGITVIPTLTWSYPEATEWLCEGLPTASTLAISAAGLRNTETRGVFLETFKKILAELRPARLLVYGHLPPECQAMALPAVHEYPTVSDQWRATREATDGNGQR